MSEALVEVSTYGKVLKTAELEPVLEGINLAIKCKAQERSKGKLPPPCSPRPAEGGRRPRHLMASSPRGWRAPHPTPPEPRRGTGRGGKGRQDRLALCLEAD